MPVLNTNAGMRYRGGRVEPRERIDAVIYGGNARRMLGWLREAAGDYAKNAQGVPLTTDKYAHYLHELEGLFGRLEGDPKYDLREKPVYLVELEYLRELSGGRLPLEAVRVERIFDCVNADYVLLTVEAARACGIRPYEWW